MFNPSQKHGNDSWLMLTLMRHLTFHKVTWSKTDKIGNLKLAVHKVVTRFYISLICLVMIKLHNTVNTYHHCADIILFDGTTASKAGNEENDGTNNYY